MPGDGEPVRLVPDALEQAERWRALAEQVQQQTQAAPKAQPALSGPVVDAEGHYCGAISKGRLLTRLQGESYE